MSKRHHSALLAAAALLALGASASAAGDASLGTSLAGESCALTGGTIVCGGQPAGSLRISQLSTALPSDGAARREAMLAAVRALPGGLATDADVTCEAPQWLGAPGNEAALYRLSLIHI